MTIFTRAHAHAYICISYIYTYIIHTHNSLVSQNYGNDHPSNTVTACGHRASRSGWMVEGLHASEYGRLMRIIFCFLWQSDEHGHVKTVVDEGGNNILEKNLLGLDKTPSWYLLSVHSLELPPITSRLLSSFPTIFRLTFSLICLFAPSL